MNSLYFVQNLQRLSQEVRDLNLGSFLHPTAIGNNSEHRAFLRNYSSGIESKSWAIWGMAESAPLLVWDQVSLGGTTMRRKLLGTINYH